MKTNYRLNQSRLLSYLRTSFCALAIAGALLALPSAEASRPEPISGQFFPCFTYDGPPRQVGENTIVTFNVTTTTNGSINGTLTGTELDVIHPDGSITLLGYALFTGSIGNRSGTLLFIYNGIGNAVTGHETLNFVAGHGTARLSGTSVQGTAEGDLGAPNPGCDVSGAGTYSGHVLFGR